MPHLGDIEKATLQILVAHKVLEHDRLKLILDDIKSDFPQATDITIEESFRRINTRMRIQNLEIKTVIFQESPGNSKRFHCLTNVSDDLIAQKFGSKLTPDEISFFKTVAFYVLDSDFIGQTEIEEMKPKGFDNQAIGALMNKFVYEKWFQRNARGYWELAPRSYAELRTAFEANIFETDENDADTRISKLPQIIFY